MLRDDEMKRIINKVIQKKIKNQLCSISKNSVLHPESRIANLLRKRKAITIGDNSHIRGELLVFAHGGSINIGKYCYVGEGTRIWSAQNIFIGDRVLISHNVNIFDSDTHPLNANLRHQQFKSIITSGHPKEIDLLEEPVHINNDVLIGCSSIILKGVTIGKGAIIGAGSVVTKDIPPWTIVAGNPATIIRELAEHER